MASVDSALQEAEAHLAGWRMFRVLAPGESPSERTFQCVADTVGLECAECGACDGARDRDVQPASVWIEVHGDRANKFHLPVVNQ